MLMKCPRTLLVAERHSVVASPECAKARSAHVVTTHPGGTN